MTETTKDYKSKVVDVLINNFTAMPKWLRSSVIVSLIFGFFYFSYIRPKIVYQNEKNEISMIQEDMEQVSKKIKDIEKIKDSNKNMYDNIDEFRDIFNALEELTQKEHEMFIKYLESTCANEEQIRQLKQEHYELTEAYHHKVNKIMDAKYKKSLEAYEDDSKK